MSEPDTLPGRLAHQVRRVAELLPHYDAIETGRFAATVIRLDLDAAVAAIGCGDATLMMASLRDLEAVDA